MAASYDSLRLRNQRAMDRRLTADHRQLARALAALVLRAATGRDEAGQPILPPSRKALDDLKAAMWEQVRAYYIGPGTDALDGPNPRSPYALLLVEGIEGATRIQAERQAALVRRLVKDPEVVRWLTGPRPMLPTREMAPTFAGRITELTLTPTRDTLGGLRGVDGRIDTDRARAALVRPRGTYEPFHSWVDPNGYRLSDRIWRTSIDVRSRIDLLLDYEVARGTSAVDIANLLEPFLTPGARGQRTVKPYGREGSFSARRLARTEITAASGRATVNAAAANPFVAQLQWRLSPSHPKIDRCDDHARGGPNGDGIYDIDKLPRYPDHPHCVTPGQLVTTQRGDVPIEQVTEGDRVLTHKGRYRRVLAAWATPHDGPVYAFETEHGSFELTGNHPVLTRRGWVNAEAVQLGEQVLYAGGSVGFDALLRETKDAPTAAFQPGIAPQVLERLDRVPVPIALDSDLDRNECDVNEVSPNAIFPFISDAEGIQFGAHRHFQRVRVGEPLLFGAFQHGRQAGIMGELGAADLASDFGPLGGVGITKQVEIAIDICEHGAGHLAARAVVFLPTGGNGIAHRPHGDIVQGEQGAQDAIGDPVLPEDLGTGEPLLDVDFNKQFSDGHTVFGFEALGMFLRGGHDNLLSLSPDDSAGRGSGNPLVSEIANPTQAHFHYTAVRAIRLSHYTGPVYNMEVADDHSYTVNGMAVHNCLCSILPVPTGSTADLVKTLKADIQAARGNLIDAASGGDPARARALQGTLSPEYLTQAMMTGNLDDAVAQAVRQAQTVRPKVPKVAAPNATRAAASEWPKFESVDEAQAWAEKNFSKWREAMADDFQEESVLTGFKGGKSGLINGHLRGYEVEGSNPKLAEHMTKLMDQSFDRPEARINQDVTVWRGMRSDLIDELRAGRPIDSVQGLVIKDKGFAATSLSQEVASTGYGVHGVVAEIRVPTGAKAIYLDMPDFHTHDYQEYEMLLPRDTQFKVLSAQQEDGITNLVLEVIL